MNNRINAHLGLLATNIFFAINLSTVKYLTLNNFMRPFGMNLIRASVSALLFWVLYLLQPDQKKIEKADIPKFLYCAFFGIAVNQMFFLKGLSFTYPIHAALLMLTTPILITVIASWLLKERIGYLKMAGLALGVTGAIVLIAGRPKTGTADHVLLGDLLILVNAISYTIYFIMVKPLMFKYHPVQVIRWVFTWGTLMIIPFGWKEFIDIKWTSFGWLEFSCILLIVIGGTFLAYLFNVYGIKVLGASIAGTYIYLQPVFATVIAVIFLHEQLELYKILAAVSIFTGVYLCNKQKALG